MFNIVIIGGMAAGCKAAARLSRLSTNYQIILIERKPLISFGNCGLPLYASGEIDDFFDLVRTSYGVVRDEDFFLKTKNVKIFINTEAIKVNTEKKEVQCRVIDKDEIINFKYDALIYATGSKAVEPKFPFPESPLISTFHSPFDAKNFRKVVQMGKVGASVIIGGGFIGCELTEALSSLWGIDTILIEKGKSLLTKFLDPEVSKVLENRIRMNGVNLLLSTDIEKIVLDEKELPVIYFNDGNRINTDYLFYNLGNKPNSVLARNAGIEIGQSGGILVDKNMRTNISNIWAAGDCVETMNLITGKPEYYSSGSLSNRMGRVVADSIDGRNSTFEGTVGSFSLKVFNLIVSATGISEQKASKLGYDVGSVHGTWSDRPDYHPETKNLYIKIIYQKPNLKLLGMQIVGEGEVTSYVDVFSELLLNNKTANNLLDIEHGYTPAHSSPISPLNFLGYMIINQEMDGVKNINPGELSFFNGKIIDVRENSEIENFPIDKNTVNIPLSDFREKVNELDNDKPTMFICEKGSRAYEAARILYNKGHKNVSYLGGGVLFYKELMNSK
ncbi:FAD-dependent oxidoreductase [Bacteroidota bacterium]